MRAFGVAACAASAALTVGIVPARAQSRAGVKLDWEPAPGCPPASAFVEGVHARSPRVHIAPDSTRTLVVRITRSPGGAMKGEIEVREADGATTQRSVRGASCKEVVSALALVTALALDPEAAENDGSGARGTGTSTSTGTSKTGTSTSTGTSKAGTSTSKTGTGTSTSTSKAGTSTSKTGTSTGTGTGAGTRAGASGGAETGGVPLEKRTWSFAAGVDAEAVLGVTPDAVFATPVFFGAARALSDHVGLGGGVRFERTGETSLVAGVGGDFTWTAGALDGCLTLRGGPVRFDTCARAHAGMLEARGDGVSNEQSATRPWVDVGLGVALRVRLAGAFFVEAQGYAGFPLVRDRFFVEPNATVFQAPIVTGHAGAGFGFEIW